MPDIAREWARGPAISAPAAELRAWFDAQQRGTEPRLTRVAITLPRGPYNHVTTQGARIGDLEVRLTDYALGVGIADRAHRCEYVTCAFIAEGYWRGDVYDLRKASQRPITPEELAAFTHVEVEGESNN